MKTNNNNSDDDDAAADAAADDSKPKNTYQLLYVSRWHQTSWVVI